MSKFRYLRRFDGHSYVKLPHHTKKNITPDPWRVDQRFDRRRGKWTNGCWYRPPTLKPYKKVSNRKHRRMMKRLVHHERFEYIPQHSKAQNELRDHWMWS